MATPGSGVRMEHQLVRGWRSEFRCWWKIAKYVEVVFDKSHNAGSISICKNCCQALSRRTCSGETELSAVGCDYHRSHCKVPFAIKSTIISVRLRDMVRPDILICYYYLQPDREPSLMRMFWVEQIRADNKETRRPRNLYVHQDTCLHGPQPQSIIQGVGVQGIYWKRCDGNFVNAVGEELVRYRKDGEVEEGLATLEYDLAMETEKIAEAAWKRHNPDVDEDEDEETKKRRWSCIVM